MELSNSLISLPLAPEKLKSPAQDTSNQSDKIPDRSAERRAQEPKRLASPEDLQRKSDEIQQSKVQKLNSLDSAPLKAQQALSTYQQTEQAGREYVEGELVGLDLFV